MFLPLLIPFVNFKLFVEHEQLKVSSKFENECRANQQMLASPLSHWEPSKLLMRLVSHRDLRFNWSTRQFEWNDFGQLSFCSTSASCPSPVSLLVPRDTSNHIFVWQHRKVGFKDVTMWTVIVSIVTAPSKKDYLAIFEDATHRTLPSLPSHFIKRIIVWRLVQIFP